jgi:hypothetical protein
MGSETLATCLSRAIRFDSDRSYNFEDSFVEREPDRADFVDRTGGLVAAVEVAKMIVVISG